MGDSGRRVLIAVVGGMLGAQGCGPGPSVDSDGSGGATLSATCGPEPALQVMGPPLEVTKLPDVPAPPPQGGALVDGIYDATTEVFYGETAQTFLPFQDVIRVRDGGTMLDWFTVTEIVQSYTYEVVPSGDTLEMTRLCPEDLDTPEPRQYTATPGQIQIYAHLFDVIFILTYVRRG